MRGRADQSIAVYRLDAPTVLAGEESTEEAAIRERGVEILFTKKDLLSSIHDEAFRIISRSGALLGKLGRTILSEALGTTDDAVVEWYSEGVKYFSSEMPDRVVNNLACCYAGLRLLEQVCSRCSLASSPVGTRSCRGWDSLTEKITPLALTETSSSSVFHTSMTDLHAIVESMRLKVRFLHTHSSENSFGIQIC